MEHSEGYLHEVLTERIKRHLKSVTDSSGLPAGEDSLQRITSNWLEKRRLFEEQIRLLGMHMPSRVAEDDPRGMIILTYSGSIVTLGREGGSGRSFEYASIELRNDVPHLVKSDSVRVPQAVAVDIPVRFEGGPVERSSDVLLIAVCGEEVSAAEEEKRIHEATVFLTNGFIKLNRTLTIPDDSIGHFTLKNIVAYLARKHELSQTVVRRMVDDYLTMIEAGALMGETVPIGGLGRLRLVRRPAKKARVGRNPATGEAITIPAQPERFVPRVSFSARFKERSAALPTGEEERGE